MESSQDHFAILGRQDADGELSKIAKYTLVDLEGSMKC